ncbi:hypothetical protein B0H14DRAFT_3719666 [Mycena olivaceomarginata]|nr:hypothetical protein B0H14DRAFT_3719666 [Mycena olivaceomarginata]
MGGKSDGKERSPSLYTRKAQSNQMGIPSMVQAFVAVKLRSKAAELRIERSQRCTSQFTSGPPIVQNQNFFAPTCRDDNSVGLSAVAQNLLSAQPIIDLVKKLAKLTLFLPETVPLATEEDDIPCHIFELEGEDDTVTSTFNRRVDILFGEHVRNPDGRLKYVRRGDLGMDCIVKYLKSIHWESAKIPLDLAQGKLARIADELDYLCGGDREPTKPAGKIADPRPSFTKDAGYEKKMDVQERQYRLAIGKLGRLPHNHPHHFSGKRT